MSTSNPVAGSGPAGETDQQSHIRAGVRHQWAAKLGDGTIIREFDAEGGARPLAAIPWEKVGAIWAIPISGDVDARQVRIPLETGWSPVWFHRTTGYANTAGPIVPVGTVDAIGFERTLDSGVRERTIALIQDDLTVHVVVEVMGVVDTLQPEQPAG